MKNTIKLNETQLRKIIAESVKKVLQESDYKTYLWAAQQAKAKGDEARAQKFFNYAQQLYSQEFGSRNGEDTQIGLGGKPNNYGAVFGSNTLGVSPRQSGNETVDGEYRVTQYGSPSNMNRSDMMNTMRNQYPKSAQQYSNAENELSDFRNGNYVYNNGWKRK